jgi:hypothetical protein
MFDIEDGMQSEVEALFGWDAEPLNPASIKHARVGAVISITPRAPID